MTSNGHARTAQLAPGAEPPSRAAQLRGLRETLSKALEARQRLLSEQWSPYEWFHRPDWSALDGVPGGLLAPYGGYGYPAIPHPRDQRQSEPPGGLPSENQWWDLIALSRSQYERNHVYTGFVDLVTNFVLGRGGDVQVVLKGNKTGTTLTGTDDRDGDGFPDPDPAVERLQAYLDEWEEAVKWKVREREFFRSLVVTGDITAEWFMREVPVVRSILPELIRTPSGHTPDGPFGWGVLTDGRDAETALALWVVEPGDTTRGRKINADRFTRHKANVDLTTKRGLPDLFACQGVPERIAKLQRNLGEVAVVQAAIAFVTHYAKGVSGTAVATMLSAGGDYTEPNMAKAVNGGSPTERDVNHMPPGTHLHFPGEQMFEAGPAQTGAEAFIAVGQMLLRILGFRWGAPEFASGDASNNNLASSLVAGGPFERACQFRQDDFAEFRKAVALKVLRMAAAARRLSQADVDRVTVTVSYPPVAIANRLEDEEVRQIQNQAGVLSKRTWMVQAGLDPKVETANIKAEKAAEPQPPSPGGFGGDGAGPFGGGGGGGGPKGQPLGTGAESVAELRADGLLYEARSGAKFSGRITDALGRARCYTNGKQVPCHSLPDTQLRRTAREMLKNPGGLTTAKLRALDGFLKGLTAEELRQLQSQFEVKHRGPRLKADRVSALLAYARGAGPQRSAVDRIAGTAPTEPAPEPPPVAAATPAPAKSMPEAIHDIVDSLKAKHAATGLVPVHEIRDEVERLFGPAAARDAFDNAMLDHRRTGALDLVSISDRSRATPDQLRKSVHAVGEQFFYVKVPDEPAGPAAPDHSPAVPAALSAADARHVEGGGHAATLADVAPELVGRPTPARDVARRLATTAERDDGDLGPAMEKLRAVADAGYARLDGDTFTLLTSPDFGPARPEVVEGLVDSVRRRAGGDNLASLADVRRDLPGVPLRDLHAAVQHVRRTRQLVPVSVEGYDGIDPDLRDASVRDGRELIGHLRMPPRTAAHSPAVRDALEAAASNLPGDVTPETIAAHAAKGPREKRAAADQLVSAWRHLHDVAPQDYTDADRAAMTAAVQAAVPGLAPMHAAGEVVPFDARKHIAPDGVSTGEPRAVVRPGWVLDEGDGFTHVPLKALVAPGGRR